MEASVKAKSRRRQIHEVVSWVTKAEQPQSEDYAERRQTLRMA